MSLLFSVIITSSGTPTDADATPALSDPTSAFGIRRTDTSAIIVAAGTLFTRVSQGVYTYTLSGEVNGVTYEAWPSYSVDGTPLNYSITKTAASTTPAVGYYASQSDVEAALSVQNVAIVSNQENTSTIATSSRIQLAINLTDALIDARLDAIGYPAPLPKPFDPRDAAILTDVAVWLTEWQLKQWRMIQSANPKAAAAFDKQVGANRQMALSTLDRIGLGFIKLIATPRADYDNTAASIQGANQAGVFIGGIGGAPGFFRLPGWSGFW